MPWQSSLELFDRLLRRQGVDPGAVADVAAAWVAFEQFLETPMDGIASAGDCDADGFIVQWGRWSWNSNRPGLCFTRQLAIPDEGFDSRPSYWQVELAIVFPDGPSLLGLDQLNESDTGFNFQPIGPARGVELAAIHDHYLGRYPQLRALFDATPDRSALSLTQAD